MLRTVPARLATAYKISVSLSLLIHPLEEEEPEQVRHGQGLAAPWRCLHIHLLEEEEEE